MPNVEANYEDKGDVETNLCKLHMWWNLETQMKKSNFNIFDRYVCKTPMILVTEKHRVGVGMIMFQTNDDEPHETISCHVDTVVHSF